MLVWLVDFGGQDPREMAARFLALAAASALGVLLDVRPRPGVRDLQ